MQPTDHVISRQLRIWNRLAREKWPGLVRNFFPPTIRNFDSGFKVVNGPKVERNVGVHEFYGDVLKIVKIRIS